MTEVLIFAGTTEGRELAAWLSSKDIHCTVSVATEYGSLLMLPDENIEVLQGRMTHEQMEVLCNKRNFTCVVDATHPFARIVSEEIQQACKKTSVPYLRLARNCKTFNDSAENSSVVYFSSVEEASSWLNEQSGIIFLTTGCKELEAISRCIDDKERLYARVLPSVESLEACIKNGITGKHIIAMQGPFSKEMNALVLKEINATFILTKETGLAGGYEEKITAAKECGCTAVVIKNPENADIDGLKDFKALTFTQTLEQIELITGKAVVPSAKKTLVLAGVGLGNPELFTQEVVHALQNADVVFGAPTVLNHLRGMSLKASCVPYYVPSQIVEYLSYHPEYEKPVVVFSGDVGFYSGAKIFYRKEKNLPFTIRTLNGISSVEYFAAKLKKSWQDWKMLSCHGRTVDYINAFQRNKACVLIVSDVNQVNEIGKNIEQAVENGVLVNLKIYIGYQLSYENECIRQVSVDDMQNIHEEGLYIILVEQESNCFSNINLLYGLDDSAFIRTKVPMTKRDVRTLILSRLQLTQDSVLYDVGCGTGSVTVEAARICYEGWVFAFDSNAEAVELTAQNIKKFCLGNVQLVHGTAPECLKEILVPTHVFIGGSSGSLLDIMKAVLEKNPYARIVATAVTIETLCNIQNALKALSVTDIDITQVSISKAEEVGSYHLMKAQNPVFIMSCNGTGTM